MGKLLYGPHQRAVEIEDRDLAHLQVVMLSKLRRGESFAFSWDKAVSEGRGRASIWISPAIPLEFSFLGGRRPALNRAWIDQMMVGAASGELQLIPEP
ncbi:hypothetical protein GCM10010988_22340 [Cnuibacter physcomitrellae]|uniref:DUF7882 domain-containing protein n=1 Tax=Cnuibacter physcomitrellae TaxID=1619308 RepID=A0A1X9LR31_9MICO|nr:hypothetical protein [Cnuibacter physcomitrellae]ARJ06902.1 hypothetical protein B5808_17970 [Cnuibacter physcomitrellae]GGI39092.1 hypothetical protein GCM10010988_22340 [Cnuibacter physcomitrellae]